MLRCLLNVIPNIEVEGWSNVIRIKVAPQSLIAILYITQNNFKRLTLDFEHLFPLPLPRVKKGYFLI
jgi:hypothetical protein